MTISQVVGAAATLAAVVVALWIAVRDGRRVRVEQADRDAGQARLVTFEVFRGGDGLRVRTKNQSMAPIFDVTVTEVHCGDRVGHVVPRPGSPEKLSMIEAGKPIEQTIEFADSESRPRPDSCEVTAHFLDAAGLRWSRTGSDPPRRILSKTVS